MILPWQLRDRGRLEASALTKAGAEVAWRTMMRDRYPDGRIPDFEQVGGPMGRWTIVRVGPRG